MFSSIGSWELRQKSQFLIDENEQLNDRICLNEYSF